MPISPARRGGTGTWISPEQDIVASPAAFALVDRNVDCFCRSAIGGYGLGAARRHDGVALDDRQEVAVA